MECIIRAHILAAEIAICSGDLDGAVLEATTGLNQAETCGFGQFAIDLLIQLARIHLAIPDPGTALAHARRALDWSSKPDVSYAWALQTLLSCVGNAIGNWGSMSWQSGALRRRPMLVSRCGWMHKNNKLYLRRKH